MSKDIDMKKVVCLLPAFNLSSSELEQIVSYFPVELGRPVIVLNDSDKTTKLRLKELEKAGNIRLIHIPYQVGKAEAIRHGLNTILQDSAVDRVLQFDGRSKQPVSQLIDIAHFMNSEDLDMVIGDRYIKQNISNQEHRKGGTSFMSLLIYCFTGYKLKDTVCGTRIYKRELAEAFCKLRSFGYGLEIEQLLISSLESSKVSSFPLNSNRQANSTNAEKIEDNLLVLVNYFYQFKVKSSIRFALSYILSKIKGRQTFDIDLSIFGGDGLLNFRYLGSSSEIIGAYTNQTALDAYSISRK